MATRHVKQADSASRDDSFSASAKSPPKTKSPKAKKEPLHDASEIKEIEPLEVDEKDAEDLERFGDAGQAVMRGWIEFRKKRRLSKYYKKWNVMYFVLTKESLVYFKSGDDQRPSGQMKLLGSSVMSLNDFKHQSKEMALNDSSRELSISHSTSKSASVSVNRKPGLENTADKPQDRTIAFTSKQGVTIYLKFLSLADRDRWMKAIATTSLNCLEEVSARNHDEIAVVLRSCARSGDLINMQISVKVDKLKWRAWKTFGDFENLHKDCVQKYVDASVVAIPELPQPPKGANLKDWGKEIGNYLIAITMFLQVIRSPEFLEFVGMLEKSSSVARVKIHVDEMLDMVKTGDVLMLSNSHWLTKIQKTVTNSEWDHVGVVVSMPIDAKPTKMTMEVIEATAATGVARFPLVTRMNAFNESGATVGWRRLNWKSSKKALKNVDEFLSEAVGLNYSLKGLVTNSATNTQQHNSFFCSQLVAECLKNLGLLQENLPSGSVLPGDFSASAKSLPLAKGVEWEGEELIVVFELPEVASAIEVKDEDKDKKE